LEIRDSQEGIDLAKTAMVAGEPVGDVRTRHCDMRVGQTVVRMRGLTNVYIQPLHRKKGYARRLMVEWIDWMRREGYEMSGLFGIQDFYHRFGYATWSANHELSIQTRDAERARGLLHVGEASAADGSELVALYNQANCLRTCSLVRPDDWPRFRDGFGDASADEDPGAYAGRGGVLAARDDSGQIVGYAALSQSTDVTAVAELASRPGSARAEVFESLLARLAATAVERRCGEIKFLLPQDHAFCAFARRYGCEVKSEYRRNGGAMGRIICLRSLFEKLAPELSRRLKEAHGELPESASAALVTDIGSVGLRCDRGEVSIADREDSGDLRVELPQNVLAQLVVGYRDVDDAIGEADVRIPAGAVLLLRTLFRLGTPYTWRADRF
jgi:predicted N-acetyltransferase YhbS